MIKASLSMKLGQSLKLTPQLTQAIRLLAMSTTELEAEITELIESNPLLEWLEDTAAIDSADPADVTGSVDTGIGNQAEAEPESGSIDDQLDLDAFHEMSDWAESPRTSGSGSDEGEASWESRTSEPFDLRENLQQQADLMRLCRKDRAIATVIIDAIDEDGYLREPNSSLQTTLLPEWKVTEAEIEAVVRMVQQCHPSGIATRNLTECLTRQLEELNASPARSIALTLVSRYLDELPKLEPEKFAARLQVAHDEVQAALNLIRSLNPRPGHYHEADDTDFIIPDLIARKYNGRWRLQLTGSTVPAIGINRYYQNMASQAKGDTTQYLHGRLQEARWLIKSLAQRGETLLKVGEAILREQGAFLDYGPEALRPLTMRQVAESIGLHESTVSRATTRKYMSTPRGLFELKRFFSSGVVTTEGGEASAIAVQAMIRKMIEDESNKKPLSDQALANQLNREGIAVARRTVAKYREAMNIPASSDRCRMG